MKNKIVIAIFLVTVLAACRMPATPVFSISIATNALTQAAFPIATPIPADIPTSTATVLMYQSTPLPPATATVPSPYEADHEAIREVISRYFDKLYFMHNSYQVDGFDDTVSAGTEASGFRQTELRKQAVDIAWSRIHLVRYASYDYSLDYSEIVVFDGGQRARANFTESNSFLDESSIPFGLISKMYNIKHIVILIHEADGWKIIYDVHDDDSHRSLYAPTPPPADVLKGLDKQLIDFTKAHAGPVLPKPLKLFILSDPAQLDRWREYETALAEKLLPQYPRDTVHCE